MGRGTQANPGFDNVDTPNPESPFVVMKFGGRSVASASNWSSITDLLQERINEGLRPVFVHSALAGISNTLEELLLAAVSDGGNEQLDRIEAVHFQLARELNVDTALLNDHLDVLRQLVDGVRLVREANPRVHARIMATGELLATTLGAEYLVAQGFNAQWRDARTLLESVEDINAKERAQFLGASCEFDPDPLLQEELRDVDGFIVTQGFIARNSSGDTVLLGRGGSDTSAAYLAARLQARRLEIWTDVPGFFSSDPKIVPAARLLRALDYSEAQEISSAGGGILHPRSISPVRRSGIPLFLRCTGHPEWEGTVISDAVGEDLPQLKAISRRSGITLISMESMEMWHQVGFLSEAFECFRMHGLSVDLISTSESNVTVSIDLGANLANVSAVDEVAEDLKRLCRVNVIRDCEAITLVGRGIRTILHELSPILEVFEEQKVHLLTQAANDLNLTFVVDAEHGYRLLQRMHALLVSKFREGGVFGPTWEQLRDSTRSRPPTPTPWWADKRDDLLQVAEEKGSAYVYNLDNVRGALGALNSLESVDAVFYSMKANSHPGILTLVNEQGANFECVSPGEIERVITLFPDIDRNRILFTPNFAHRSEYEWGVEQGVWVTLDNLHPIRYWPDVFAGKEIFVRVDTGQGRGHHEHVRTAGVHSKFGVPLFELEELKELVAAAGARVVGLHAHTGSGILEPENWEQTGSQLTGLRELFPEVRYADVGGGLGIAERPSDAPLDLEHLDVALRRVKTGAPEVDLWIEPGRFVVAQSGVLVTRVTQTKGKGDIRYVGVGTGMNSFIRPALYGAYHEIVNLTRLGDSATEIYTIVGPICETGDRLGSDRLLPETKEGDVLLIANAGAYGYVMSSQYNLRDAATEVLL
jgi:diaminopimelate decarboxylase/aspartate kinase